MMCSGQTLLCDVSEERHLENMMKTTLLAVVVCFIGLTTTTSVSASTNTTSVSTNATSLSTPTNTSLSTPTNTSLSTPTNTSLSTPTNTSLSTPTNTSLSTPTNTSLSTPTNTSLSTPTNTSLSTSTNTSLSTSTNTSLSTSTNTSLSASTNTSLSTSTNTSLSTSTNTSLSASTNTSLSTSTNTSLSTSTNATSVSTNATSLSTSTNTSLSTSTNATSVSTNATSLSTPTNTSLSTSTNTPLSTSTNTSLSTSTNMSLSPPTITSLSTSTNTTYVSTSTDTASVSASTSASKTILTPPPPSMSPHPEKAYFNLGFSLKINATFTNDLKNVTSSEYAKYSKAFKYVLSQVYEEIPGFSHIVIKGFRNGSIICDYTAVITATANPDDVIRRINDTLKKKLQMPPVDSKYLQDTWIKDLKAADDEMESICNAENICDIGYKCNGTGNRTKCTSNCEGEDCGDHGVCQLKADGQPICRCKMHPKYVYSGDKCEIKAEQLLLKSEYIAAIAGGGGGGLVLILVIALICTCARKRKAKEKRDGPLSAYDESPGQHWTSHSGDPRRHNNPGYEAVEMDVLPPQRAQHGSGEEPFYVYQPSNITTPMTRASAEYASFMDEGRTGAAHDLHIKNRADTSYTNRYGNDERHNTGEGASRDAGHVPASLEADIIDDVRRHDRMRQAHDRTGPNRVSVAGLYPEITKHPRDGISITPNTPQMQIENSKLDRREQDVYPSRDHRGQDDEQSRGRYHHGQDGYPSRDHLRRVDSRSLDRREQEGYQSRDQRGQDSYIPRDRNLERLHREERMSDRQRQSPGSFGDDRRSPRETDYGHQPAHPSPLLRQKGLGEMRHPHSFITTPDPDYGVDHGSVTEHDRHRPSQRRDNDAGEGRQLYRNESYGNVNDSQFARDLQRRRTEIKSQGEGVMDRMIDTRDRRGQWENSDRRNENRSRQRRGDYQMNHHL
ncbi:mucin-3B-like isoform X2 [Haliotis rufescens]|uniref:mucin-3B-like isoform X2 n=1 Tax=Haliotis rufescens TaxID=6454 RepID=UPI00201F8F4B|nr:mucin-3B-like isoform X2 [Haliotis rufescens]